MGGAEGQAGDERRGGLGGGDDLGALEAGEVERLRGRAEGDAALGGGARDGEEGQVGRPRQGQRRVDLVGEDPAPVALRGRGDRLQLLPVGNAAARVVGAAEDQRHRALSEAPLDRLGVEPAVHQWRFGQLAPELLDHPEERVVDGGVDHHRVAGLGDRLQQGDDRADHVGTWGRPHQGRPPSPSAGPRSRRKPRPASVPAARSSRSHRARPPRPVPAAPPRPGENPSPPPRPAARRRGSAPT